MNESIKNKDISVSKTEIDLIEFFYILWDSKKKITLITGIISIVGVIYSLLLPNIYESKAILSPVNPSSGISKSIQSYSGLAGVAGLNLPSSAPILNESNSVQAIEKLESLSFFENNILPNIYLPDLMALKSWDYKTNTQIYDNELYDEKSNTWVRDYAYPFKQIPSAQESFITFKESHLNISQDLETSFVTIKVKHQSPLIAQKWTELIVNEINSFYSKKDAIEAQKVINFLNVQMIATNFSEVKVTIAELLQQETKKLALIEAKKYYVFDYIDPPASMELKSEPKRAIICILIAILGGVLSSFYVLIDSLYKKNMQNHLRINSYE